MTKRALVGAWILTPVVVWLGAFLAGWIGARLGGTVTWLVFGGLVGGLAFLAAWAMVISYIKKHQHPETPATIRTKT